MPATKAIYSVSGHQIEVTAKRVRKTFQHQLSHANLGVTVEQWIILQALANKGGQSQLELSKAVYKDQPSVTRILDKLVKKELITRNADDQDRRKFRIFLTAKGEDMVKKILPLVDVFREKAFGGIDKKQLAQFQKTLEIIAQNLD